VVDLDKMMQQIVLIGLNHKTAPVALRDCLAFSEPQIADAMATLQQADAIQEVLLFSTCNRVELLMAVSDRMEAASAAKQYLVDHKNVAPGQFEDALYQYDSDEAVRHVFQVASCLDSMVLGEPQILGQMKQAYHIAAKQKSTGVILNRLMHRAFFVAKKVRTETGIGDNAVSISYTAIELGRKIFGDLSGKKILLIGAGEMAELAVEHLLRQQVGQISVANRTFERGVTLARKYTGEAIRFEEISEKLKDVDIIISSTGAPDFVIEHGQIKAVMRSRRNRPLFFIDIAVPRDIDPKINRLNNVYLYDIDDLKGVVEENLEDRQHEAIKAQRFIDEAVIQFRSWYENLAAVPTIVALRSRVQVIADAEFAKTIQGLPELSIDAREAVLRMKTSLINKIMHHPTIFLKKNGCHGDKSVYLDTIRKLFDLDDPTD